MTSTKKALHAITHPHSIVIAGASNNLSKIGAIQTFNLLEGGYDGDVVFIHPKADTILGRPAYPSPADIPFVPDLAFLVTPARITIDLLDKLGEKGVRQAIVVTAGFREMGPEGEALEHELGEVAEKHGIRFLGPNCIGAINAHAKMNLTFFAYANRPGGLGLISQSGTYVTQVMEYLRDHDIGYSKALSVGNSANIDLVDCLDYLGDDPETKAIALYIEGIKRGREFIEVARRVTRKKPVVAYYIGGSSAGSRSGKSHTGSMAGPDSLYEGIFEQAGVHRVHSLDDLYGVGHALASQPLPAGDRVAILTHSGGPGSSIADALEKMGASVPELGPELKAAVAAHLPPMASPRNPVDLTFSLEHEVLTRHVPKLFFESDEIDAVMIHGIMDTGLHNEMYRRDPAIDATKGHPIPEPMHFDMEPLIEMQRRTGKPLIATTLIWDNEATRRLSAADVPVYRMPDPAARAMFGLVRAARLRQAQQGFRDFDAATPTPAQHVAPSIKAPTVLDEHRAKALLKEHGVAVVEEALAETLEQARGLAQQFGYPVVLKGLSAGVAHKSEAGLVKLNLRSDSQLAEAWAALDAAAPGCDKLLAPMLTGDRELMVGMSRFPGFGPCVALGIGGVFTESIQDITFRAAPVTREEALTMPDALRLRRLFDGQRGKPAIEREVLAETLVALSTLALEHPEIAEIDINPLLVVDGRPVAVDAMMTVNPPVEPTSR